MKAKGWKRHHENKGKQNVYAKFRLRAKKITRYREGYYIMVKESILPRLAILNMYAPNSGATKI